MITNLVIFAFVVGLLSGAVIVGAIAWVKELGWEMTWWKCLLSALWYFLLLFLLFAAFTFIGEGWMEDPGYFGSTPDDPGGRTGKGPQSKVNFFPTFFIILRP